MHPMRMLVGICVCAIAAAGDAAAQERPSPVNIGVQAGVVSYRQETWPLIGLEAEVFPNFLVSPTFSMLTLFGIPVLMEAGAVLHPVSQLGIGATWSATQEGYFAIAPRIELLLAVGRWHIKGGVRQYLGKDHSAYVVGISRTREATEP
jgi:hypothetical protein